MKHPLTCDSHAEKLLPSRDLRGCRTHQGLQFSWESPPLLTWNSGHHVLGSLDSAKTNANRPRPDLFSVDNSPNAMSAMDTSMPLKRSQTHLFCESRTEQLVLHGRSSAPCRYNLTTSPGRTPDFCHFVPGHLLCCCVRCPSQPREKLTNTRGCFLTVEES